MSTAALQREEPVGRWVRLAPWLLLLLLALRLCLRTRAFAVDLFYWDEWDYRDLRFSGASFWQLFHYQHVGHRLGLGGLLLPLLDAVSGWDGRAEAWACALCGVLAGAVGLWLSRRLLGPSPWDVLVPLCLVTGLHADAAAGAAVVAYEPLPLLLTLTLSLVAVVPLLRQGLPEGALSPRKAARDDLLLLAVDLACLFTGYAFLVAPFARLLLLVRMRAARGGRALLAVHLGALLLSLATLWLALHDYTVARGVACFVFPWPHPLDYLRFGALLLERPLGISGVAGLRALPVFGVAAALVAVLLVALFRAGAPLFSRAPRDGDPAAVALVPPAALALVFAALAAVGRVCQGVDAAVSPRYVGYACAGLFALTLAARALVPAGPLRTGLLSLLLVAFVGKELKLSLRPLNETREAVETKQRLHDCLLAQPDLRACEASTGLHLHPFPAESQVQQKLDWLRERHLGLFR